APADLRPPLGELLQDARLAPDAVALRAQPLGPVVGPGGAGQGGQEQGGEERQGGGPGDAGHCDESPWGGVPAGVRPRPWGRCTDRVALANLLFPSPGAPATKAPWHRAHRGGCCSLGARTSRVVSSFGLIHEVSFPTSGRKVIDRRAYAVADASS